MWHPVKMRKIGNSLGVTISEQVREIELSEGDTLFVEKTPNGIEPTSYDPDFAQAMDDAREFMRAYPNAMKALAERATSAGCPGGWSRHFTRNRWPGSAARAGYATKGY